MIPFQVLSKFPGKELEGRTYQPLFPYFARLKGSGAFRVLCDGYVRADSGTGVVHQAPAFGEDDYRIGIQHGAKPCESDCHFYTISYICSVGDGADIVHQAPAS